MDVQHQMLPMNIIIMTMLIMMNMLMLMKMSLLVAPVKGAVETMLPLTLGQLLLLERGVLTRLSWLRRLNTMMLLSANIPTARSVTPLTPLTLSQQEEECEENFIKNCFIEYKKVASDEKVQFCNTPLICDGEGPEECRTVYESQCSTRYHEHDVEDDVVECETIQEEKCEDVTQGYTTEKKCTKWPKQVCTKDRKRVKKYSPETECKKVPRELCGPSGCLLKPGPEECFDRTETVVSEVPEETCNLEPQKECKHVTKLVPLLKPAEECVDIPKEVCSRSRTNPRKVQKPVVKKWCYVPTAESGLA